MSSDNPTSADDQQETLKVYQHERYRAVLEGLVTFFGCGRITPKGPKSRVLTYAVEGLTRLDERIVPFFDHHRLVVKDRDFQLFAEIIRSMRRKEHLDSEGFERLVRLAYSMNEYGKQRARSLDEILRGSSETARQARPSTRPVKIQSDLHGDMESEAEMTSSLGSATG